MRFFSNEGKIKYSVECIETPNISSFLLPCIKTGELISEYQ